MSEGAGEARTGARRLLAHGASALPPGSRALATAWALKEICYESWGSDPPQAAGAAAALRALFEAGVPPAQTHEIEGLVAWTAGIVAINRGQMADAVVLFDTAAAGLRAAGQPDPAAQTQVPKIMALSMLGQHTQAAACGEAAQRELLALGNLKAASRVSQNLGAMQFRRDAYAEAARHYREATVLFARQGEHTQSVLADIGLGDALTALGDFDEALRIYARARMRASNLALDRPLALVDESVALLDLARGRYREALAGFESARRRYEQIGVPQYLAIAEKQLADAYLELRLLPEALALLDAAVARFRALDLPDEQAWALTQRGRAEALLGLTAAEASFAAAARLFASQHNAVGEASVGLASAELALASGDTTAALGWAEQSAAGFASAGQADGMARAAVLRGYAHLQAGQVAEARVVFEATLARARAGQQLQVQVRCLTGQGLAARALRDAPAASTAFEAAIELFEDQRRALPGEEVRSAFLTDHLRPYQEQLRSALEAGQGVGVLQQLERFRARALDELLAEGAPPPPDDETVALRERVNWLYRRVQRLQDDAEPSAVLARELASAEHELLERARRQRLAAPLAQVQALAGLDLAALQAALGPRDALVEYGVMGDELFACVVTPGKVRLVRHLASWTMVLDAVRALRFQIDSLRHGAAPVRQHLAVLEQRTRLRLARLEALVWSPLALQQDLDRVLIVPQGPLGTVPFAALPGVDGALGEQLSIALAPSARAALRGLRREPAPARQALAFGDSSRLEHAADEARQVASMFASGHALVGAQVTLGAVQTGAPGMDVLHFACHAQFRSDNPRFSALHLHDGLLTVADAERLRLGPCTVVLSACESGLADVGHGDEMVGLVRAFLVAGASRVLASLWPVDDEVTAVFMTSFYRALMCGRAPAAALRQAQADTRSLYTHPYFWAAFTLYGGW